MLRCGGTAELSEGDGGEGTDTVDYTPFEDPVAIHVADGRPITVDTGDVRHELTNFEVILATRQEDSLILGGTPADGTDVVQINRAFQRGLGEATTQLIDWTLTEGLRDSKRRP